MNHPISQRNLRPGGVLQIRTAAGYRYAICSHKNEGLGHLIRVLPGTYKRPLRTFASLALEPELYAVFLLWGNYLDKSLIKIVSYEALDEDKRRFPLFRAGVEDGDTRRVATWWLWDGVKEWRVGKLRESQVELPLRETWDGVMLIRRLEENWSPGQVT